MKAKPHAEVWVHPFSSIVQQKPGMCAGAGAHNHDNRSLQHSPSKGTEGSQPKIKDPMPVSPGHWAHESIRLERKGPAGTALKARIRVVR